MVTERIHTVGKRFLIDDRLVEGHYYTRFIGEKTECWFFTTGIGDQTMCQQMGDSFLTLCDEGKDPELGRIMFSMGIGPGAFAPYRGDFNVCWPWGVLPYGMKDHLESVGVKQHLVIGPWKERRDEAEEAGIATMDMNVGVGRFFKPLFLDRSGLGYAGIDNKGDSQTHIVLGPALERGDFEWRAKGIDDEWITTEELNVWYNTKKILFGMIQESRQGKDYLPTRFPETLASGTPLIIYRIPHTEKYLGHEYPYMTESYEETEAHIEAILDNYPVAITYFLNLAQYIRTEHSYEKKLVDLFERLSEL